jgi:hypothetical protein
VTFFFIAVAVGYVLSQPPFWNKLRQPHSAVLFTTILIVAAVSIIGAAFWTLIAIPLIPRQSELQLEVQLRRPYIIKRTGESDSWLAVFPSVVITSREEQKLTLSFRWLVPHRVGSDLTGATTDPYHELKVEAMGRPPAAWGVASRDWASEFRHPYASTARRWTAGIRARLSCIHSQWSRQQRLFHRPGRFNFREPTDYNNSRTTRRYFWPFEASTSDGLGVHRTPQPAGANR